MKKHTSPKRKRLFTAIAGPCLPMGLMNFRYGALSDQWFADCQRDAGLPANPLYAAIDFDKNRRNSSHAYFGFQNVPLLRGRCVRRLFFVESFRNKRDRGFSSLRSNGRYQEFTNDETQLSYEIYHSIDCFDQHDRYDLRIRDIGGDP